MSFVICHLLLKGIVFFELLVAISFSIAFALLISAMRLLIWMNCFSQEIQKWQSVGLELVILNCFENSELNLTISI